MVGIQVGNSVGGNGGNLVSVFRPFYERVTWVGCCRQGDVSALVVKACACYRAAIGRVGCGSNHIFLLEVGLVGA